MSFEIIRFNSVMDNYLFS